MKVVVLGLLLCAGTALAQPAKSPPPPKPQTPPPSNETLQQGQRNKWDEGVSPDQMRAASRAFQQGNQDLADGIPERAVERYREALKIWPHPIIYYNLALALLPLDRPVETAESLEKALEGGLVGLNNQQDKLDRAKEYLILVQKQIANVEISCQKEGAKVSVDGKHEFTVEKGKPNIYKGRVRIGKHTFVAEKPGYATPVDAPFIGPGETFRIELKLYTAEELTRYKRMWPKAQWAPWVVIGGGVLAGGIAGIMHLSANSSYDEFDTKVARCSQDVQNNSCDATAFADLKSSGDTKRTLGFVGYGIAGAALLTGGVLLYLNRRVAYQITTDEYRMEQLRTQRKAVSFAPLIAPGTGGALITGEF